MLTIFRRHVKGCSHRSRRYRRCACPIHVEGSLAGEPIRKALDLSSWEVLRISFTSGTAEAESATKFARRHREKQS